MGSILGPLILGSYHILCRLRFSAAAGLAIAGPDGKHHIPSPMKVHPKQICQIQDPNELYSLNSSKGKYIRDSPMRLLEGLLRGVLRVKIMAQMSSSLFGDIMLPIIE